MNPKRDMLMYANENLYEKLLTLLRNCTSRQISNYLYLRLVATYRSLDRGFTPVSELLVASSTAGGAENNGDDGFERMGGWKEKDVVLLSRRRTEITFFMAVVIRCGNWCNDE